MSVSVDVRLRFHHHEAFEEPTEKRDLTISGVYHHELFRMPSMMKVGGIMRIDGAYFHIMMVHFQVSLVDVIVQRHDGTWLQEGLDQVGAELLVSMTRREELRRRMKEIGAMAGSD